MGQVEKLVEYRTAHHCAQSEASHYFTNTSARVRFRFNNPIVCQLTTGMKVFRVGGSTPFNFMPGDAMYVPPDMEIDVDLSAASFSAPIACNCIEIERSRVEGVLARLNDTLESNSKATSANIRWDQYAVFKGEEAERLGLRELMRLFTEQRDVLSDLRIETRIDDLMLAVLQARSTELLALQGSPADNGVFAAARFVRDNLNIHLCSETLAEKACMSPATLHRKFQQNFGLSPRKFANQLRVSQAKYRLRNSNYPIAEIANQLGFSDVSHFTRVFRKSVGETPAEYRRHRLTPVTVEAENGVPIIEAPVHWPVSTQM